MAHLAWIASEVGSATGFPKETRIPEKPQSDKGRERWLDAAYSIHHTTLLLLPDGIVFTELVNSRMVGNPEIDPPRQD